MTTMSESTPFSVALRERTSAAHSSSEHSGFMADLIKGQGTKEDYTALVAQHWFIYEALENAAEQLREDAIASAFISDALTRMPALEADLKELLGENWREQIEATPATARYVDRINDIAHWAGGFVAHHYTRYLGDLSGGLFIGKVMKRQFGFTEAGASFYVFDDIADPQAFKEEYRALLDSAAWDDEEKERVIEEALVAYQFNTEVFQDLAAAKSAE